jgi:hypothetical protein
MGVAVEERGSEATEHAPAVRIVVRQPAELMIEHRNTRVTVEVAEVLVARPLEQRGRNDAEGANGRAGRSVDRQ